MAVEITTQDVTVQPGGRRRIEDLNPGVARQRTKLPGLLDILLGTLPPGVLPQGSARLLVGTSPRNEARESVESRKLNAKILRDVALAERTFAETDIIRAGPSPVDEETRRIKLETLRALLPLELSSREIDLEKEQLEIRRAAAFFPLIDEEKRAQIDRLRSLTERRDAETATILELAQVEAEQVAAENRLIDARAGQETLNRELIETAIGGLDGFQKMIFLRNRLFPPPSAPVRRATVRTIRAF